MADDHLRYLGVGWPNGAVTGGNDNILALPSPEILMLSSELWHHDEAIRAGKRVLVRGVARQGFRPAELGWNARTYVDEILRDTHRCTEPIREFVAWNEMNLQPERGDQRADDRDLDSLYDLVGRFQLAVLSELRRREATRNALLHFGAWAPKEEITYTVRWKAAADAADVIDVHSYGTGESIAGYVDRYRALFPDKPICLTEWHSDGGAPEQDRQTLELLADLAARDHQFRAYYFLWRWDNPPGHQRDLAASVAVEGNHDRLTLFTTPPTRASHQDDHHDVVAPIETVLPETGTSPEPAEPLAPPAPPDPLPDDQAPLPAVPLSREAVVATIVRVATELGIEPYELLAGAISESDLDPNAWRDGVWPDKSAGAFQQTVKYADEGDHSDSPENIALIRRLYGDVEHAARVAARQYLYWRHNPDVPPLTAWVSYNGPSFYHSPEQSPNYQNYARGLIEAAEMLGVDPFNPKPAPATAKVFLPDSPIRQQSDGWSCAVHATAWMRNAAGEDVLYATVASQMAAIDTSDVGLHDASGAELASNLSHNGFVVGQDGNASWDRIWKLAGNYPMVCGGRAWSHWVGVRGKNATDLLLANSADGYKGIHQSLGRADFDRLGPFSCVWLPQHGPQDQPAPPPPPPAPADQYAELRKKLDDMVSAIGYLGDDVSARVSALSVGKDGPAERDAIAAELRRVRIEQIGPRPVTATSRKPEHSGDTPAPKKG